MCVGLAAQGAVPSFAAEAEAPPEPALLLRYAAPDVSEAAAREVLGSLPGTVAAQVRVRWVAVPSGEVSAGDVTAEYPLADDAALRSISGKISEASVRMENVELEPARALLSQAEAEARRFRFTDAVRPLLAEISLQQGILKLWGGDAAGAEAPLSRFRALRPDFSPDPALFSPQFLAVWNDVRQRPMPEAELLVQSMPSGARITADGAFRGTTPARIHPGTSGPVTIRLSHPGYKDAATTGQWLPGDTETIRVTLEGDREARLGELLARSGGRGASEAGPLLTEFAREANVERVAVLTVETATSGDGYRASLYSGGASAEIPVFMGSTEVPGGSEGSERLGTWAAAKLLQNGWPAPRKDEEEKPWYKAWWVWGALAAGIGMAFALGGGGGSSGGSGSSVAVNF